MRHFRNSGRRSWGLLGALFGLLLSGAEWVFTLWMGVSFNVDGRDVSGPLMLFFALTYVAMGWALGRLMDAKLQLQQDAETIARQHAKVLQFEKLASVGRLAAGVAHELRNSLGVVGSASSLLLESVENADGEQQKAGRFIQEEIHRLDGFVRSLLDFSKPIYPQFVPLRLKRVFEHVRARQGTARSSAVSIKLPNESLCCHGDSDLLTQALLALVLNAQEAIGANGVVELSAKEAEGFVHIEVADDGPSISDESKRRIFEPFFSTKTEGTGLGLCMAQRIVEAHHGNLVLRSRGGLGPDGRGACFRITLRMNL